MRTLVRALFGDVRRRRRRHCRPPERKSRSRPLRCQQSGIRCCSPRRFPAEVRAAEAAGAVYPRVQTAGRSTSRRCAATRLGRCTPPGRLPRWTLRCIPRYLVPRHRKIVVAPGNSHRRRDSAGVVVCQRAKSLEHPKLVHEYQLTTLASGTTWGVSGNDPPSTHRTFTFQVLVLGSSSHPLARIGGAFSWLSEFGVAAS